ncbi:hypothetical protein B0O80DRAFT_499792 [Mortierella sp. GBAus27b]|nr:hypothetical protein B0O80DRAFT_499792 [Mortierella sp. GBAus27b]
MHSFLFKSLFLACTAVVVLAQREYDALVSSTHFVGTDTTIPGQSGRDIFIDRRNHPSAVASILLDGANRAGFRPHHQGVITDSDVFGQYIHHTTRFPAVKPQIEYGSELKLNGDRHQLQILIEKEYHTTVNSPKAIAEALLALIPAQLPPGRENQVWVLSHTTLLSQPDQDITFELAYIALTLTSLPETGHVQIVPQSAHFSANAYRIDSDFVIENAHRLAERIRTHSVARFLEELTTSDGGCDGSNSAEQLETWVHGKDSGKSGHRENFLHNRLFHSPQLKVQH